MTPRTLKLALGLSLVANLLVAGAVAGAFLSDGPPRAHDGARGDPMRMIRALDRDTRRTIRQTLSSDPDLQADRDRLRQTGAEVGAALRADPFDRAALISTMTDRLALQGRMGARGIEVLADALERMTPEDRADFAQNLEERRDSRRAPNR